MTVTVIQGSFEQMIRFFFEGVVKEAFLSTKSNTARVVYDIPRTHYFVGNPEDLGLLVSSWKSIAGKEQEKEYQQGLMDARLFPHNCAFYRPALRKFLLEMHDDPSRLLRDPSENFHGDGVVYLADLPEAAKVSAESSREPAGFAIFCKKGAPDIWMLCCLQKPSRPSSERSVTCMLPTMLLPSGLDISDPGRIEQETGLKLTTVKNFQDVNLPEIIRNSQLSKVISLLFEGNVCVESRLALLNLNHPSRDDFMRVVNPEPDYVKLCHYYYDMDSFKSALLAQDVSACKEVLTRTEQAAQALKDSPTFKENLASFHRAFVKWGASLVSAHFEEAVKTRQSLLQEFRHCCRIISEGVSIESGISADDVSRAMMILAVQYPNLAQMIEQDSMQEPLSALLSELRKALPWITELRRGQARVCLNTKLVSSVQDPGSDSASDSERPAEGSQGRPRMGGR